jgi:hypothetical protein
VVSPVRFRPSPSQSQGENRPLAHGYDLYVVNAGGSIPDESVEALVELDV